MNRILVATLTAALLAGHIRAETVDIDITPSDVRIYGQERGRGTLLINVGTYLATGDFNGDGLMDIATAGPSVHRPTVAIIFGRSPWPAVLDLRSVEPDVAVRESPRYRVDSSCFSYPPIREQTDAFTNLAAGDVTGDGIDDLVVGGACWDRGGGLDGIVLVIPGRLSWPGTVDVDPDTWSPALLGPRVNGLFGESVAVADVNGDGIADLIVGASDAAGALTGARLAGRVYIVLGPIADTQHEVETSGILLDGVDSSYHLGRTIDSGYLSPEHPKALMFGDHYRVPGRILFLDGSRLEPVAPIDATLALIGQVEGDLGFFGQIVDVGDVDCSGRGDLLSLNMLVETAASAPYRAGRVDLLRDVVESLGARSPGPDLAVYGRVQRLTGFSRNDYMIRSVRLADIDADGFDDMIIGQPSSEGPAGDVVDRGDVTIIWGRPDIPPVVDLESDSEWQLTILGGRAGLAFGFLVDAFDLDGNGRLDLVVGSFTQLKSTPSASTPDGGIDIFLRNLHVTTIVPEAGPDQIADIVAGATDCSAPVTLDASGSIDSDGHVMRHRWYEGMTFLAEGEVVTVSLSVGEHCVRLLSTSDGGWAQDKLHVTVRDQAPPEIRSITVNPADLWPPNHRMMSINVEVDAWDACTSASDLSVRLLSVTSNEPADDRGDGHSAPDMDGWNVGTADFNGELRAERSGRRRGREYSLTYEVVDAAGNAATGSLIVPVRHDRRDGARSRTRR